MKVNQIQYQFKHASYGNEWQDFSRTLNPIYDHEDVALELAEEMFSDDPCDPYSFKSEIQVKDDREGVVKTFLITAEASVNFQALELEKPEEIKSNEN